MKKVITPRHSIGQHYNGSKGVLSSGIAFSHDEATDTLHIQGLKSNGEPVTMLGICLDITYLDDAIKALQSLKEEVNK